MKTLLVMTSLLISVNSFAANRESGGIGPMATYATCSGSLLDGEAVNFTIHSTALTTLITSTLVTAESNELLASLKCEEGGNIVRGTPSAGQVAWICNEYQNVDDGDISVEIIRGGFSGILTGQIKQKQMFPLPAKVIGTLICK